LNIGVKKTPLLPSFSIFFETGQSVIGQYEPGPGVIVCDLENLDDFDLNEEVIDFVLVGVTS